MYFDVTSFHKGCGRMNDDHPQRQPCPHPCNLWMLLYMAKKKKLGGVGNGDIILDYLGGL